MEQSQSSDRLKQLLEMALSAGRNWQSPQSGYVHYCYSIQDENRHEHADDGALVRLGLHRFHGLQTDNSCQLVVLVLGHATLLPARQRVFDLDLIAEAPMVKCAAGVSQPCSRHFLFFRMLPEDGDPRRTVQV